MRFLSASIVSRVIWKKTDAQNKDSRGHRILCCPVVSDVGFVVTLVFVYRTVVDVIKSASLSVWQAGVAARTPLRTQKLVCFCDPKHTFLSTTREHELLFLIYGHSDEKIRSG